MGISDLIEQFIDELLSTSEGSAEFGRAELAGKFNCVPSQINYVISTRFSPERGYIVESRRGGGGYIRVRRVKFGAEELVMHTVNAVGMTLDYNTARALIANLLQNSAVSEPSARLMLAAIGNNALRAAPPAVRDEVRAGIFKQMLINIL